MFLVWSGFKFSKNVSFLLVRDLFTYENLVVGINNLKSTKEIWGNNIFIILQNLHSRNLFNTKIIAILVTKVDLIGHKSVSYNNLL